MKHQSAEAYFLDIAEFISEDLDPDFRSEFLKRLRERILDAWSESETGIRESYQLDEEELESIWIETSMEITNMHLKSLSNKGLINAFIRADGEVVFKLTEEGEKYTASIKD